MRNNFTALALCILLVGTHGVGQAASVGNEASESSETRSGRRMEQTEGMQLKKGNTKRATTGREKRSTESAGTENNASESISLEIGASALLIPIMQRAELGQFGLNTPLEGEIKNCAFLSAKQPVPLGDFFGVNMLMWGSPMAAKILMAQEDQKARNFGAHSLGWLRDPITGETFTPEQFNARPRKVFAQGMIVEAYDGEPVFQALDGVNSFYRVRPAANLVRCYFAYGVVLADALQQLARMEGSRVSADRNGNRTIIVRGDLEPMAVRAVAAALANTALHDRILEYTRNTIRGGCMLPTATGLVQGDTAWSCGALKVDPENATATLGGMPVMAENTYMGQRLQVAQSISHSNARSANDSRSRYSSTDASTESGRELVVGRNRASTTEQNSSTGISSRSNTTASPK